TNSRASAELAEYGKRSIRARGLRFDYSVHLEVALCAKKPSHACLPRGLALLYSNADGVHSKRRLCPEEGDSREAAFRKRYTVESLIDAYEDRRQVNQLRAGNFRFHITEIFKYYLGYFRMSETLFAIVFQG